MTSPMKVLDAYALMAYLEGEPGSEMVRNLLMQSVRRELDLAVTTVNLGEVFYNIARTNSVEIADQLVVKLIDMPIEIVSVDWKLARQAARLKAETPIAFADCFAAALAQIRDCAVVTGDKEFQRLEGRVRVEWM
jgi:predicted nucleic acid-binding protein